MTAEADYGFGGDEGDVLVEAPALDYLPPAMGEYRPKIGLIGAGGITKWHLDAYKKLGLEVVAICDRDQEKAEVRRDEFYPDAEVYEDHRDVLGRDDVEIVDAATHPGPRVGIIEDAISAGKHVLSQKPFVLDLEVGEKLCDLADAKGVKLAVNQNGRWAPHFSYLRGAIETDVIGDVSSVDFFQQWDHTWTKGTPFEEIHHLVLYDYGIHWFDAAVSFLGGKRPEKVYASVSRSNYQEVKPPFLAQVVADFEGAQVRMGFNAQVSCGEEDRTVVCGESGTLRACGPGFDEQSVRLWTKEGEARPELEGTWFTNGFAGTMAELVCSIGEGREPSHAARGNLDSLAFCFAAIRSADTGEPQKPGAVTRLEK